MIERSPESRKLFVNRMNYVFVLDCFCIVLTMSSKLQYSQFDGESCIYINKKLLIKKLRQLRFFFAKELAVLQNFGIRPTVKAIPLCLGLKFVCEQR
mgnify:CR=1 FL=1